MFPRTISTLLAAFATIAATSQAAEKYNLAKLDLNKLPPAAAKNGLTYAKDIRPMFEASCFRCHGEEQQKGQLRLDSLEALLKGGKHGKIINPGNSKESHLIISAAQIEEETAMPPKRRPGGPGGQGKPGGGPGGTGATSQSASSAPKPSGAPKGPGGQRGPSGPPAKPLTSEQVGLIRAWIDQGGK